MADEVTRSRRSILSLSAAALIAASCHGPVVGSLSTAMRRVPEAASSMSSNHLPVKPG
jgi:hypothetical protein